MTPAPQFSLEELGNNKYLLVYNTEEYTIYAPNITTAYARAKELIKGKNNGM